MATCLAVVVPVGVWGSSSHSPLAVAAVMAVATLAAHAAMWPRTRHLFGVSTGVLSMLSLGTVGLWHHVGAPMPAGPWPLLTTAVLIVYIAVLCRIATSRISTLTVAVAIVAESVLAVPITGAAELEWGDRIAVCGFWSLAGIAGIAAGLYLRRLDEARVRAVAQARRAQRVQLATDLHDFVAHDVSAMVIQAQAARILLNKRAADVADVLAAIEGDGTRALNAMDRTIRVLRELEDVAAAARTPLPDATELPDLIQRYAAAWDGPVTVAIDPGLEFSLLPEASTTVYRVVVEALTNVRRHAPLGAAVDVRLHRSVGGVTLVVTNRSCGPPAGRQSSVLVQSRRDPVRRHGGTGLRGLAERVEMLGGTLDYGPQSPAGWQLHVDLPADVLRTAS
ncbi:sensor histidine kinase [Plantactinospora endophytica]|uniref:histidine kinase n=1 Tax=Plantactinospora endophytica TaxID=673535 RepID=A0ABQ4EEE8_9ACTN|nr:ATP-binding protein [Plantactinospora endophytica]GIG93099.1 two-component sensor histidine kinase [Plantactinospora endophytica]